MKRGLGKTMVRWLIALAMIASGVLHFVATDRYAQIVPAYLPAHTLLVQLSGVAELLGGLGLLVPHPALRRWASYGLIALLVAVFPANVNMALHDIAVNGKHLPTTFLWLRLPLQLVLVWLTWWCTAPTGSVSART